MFVLTSVVILAPRGTKPQLLTPLWRQSNIPLTALRPRPSRKTKMLRIYRDDKIIAVSNWKTIILIPTTNKAKQTKKKNNTRMVNLWHPLYVFFKYFAHVAQSSQHLHSVCMVWLDQCPLGTDVYLRGIITFKYKSVYILIRFFIPCSYIYVIALSFEGALQCRAPRDNTMHQSPYKTACLCINLVTSDSIVHKKGPEILSSTPLAFLRNDSRKFAKP